MTAAISSNKIIYDKLRTSKFHQIFQLKYLSNSTCISTCLRGKTHQIHFTTFIHLNNNNKLQSQFGLLNISDGFNRVRTVPSKIYQLNIQFNSPPKIYQKVPPPTQEMKGPISRST